MIQEVEIGVIGGSGLYEMETLSDVSRVTLDTPFGGPSDEYIVGTLGGKRVAFLPRHGRSHSISPSELNFRANVYGFKMLGARRLISVTAVGGLRERIRPLDMVVPDQFLDRTFKRKDTFFTGGLVAHVSLTEPVCPGLSGLVQECAAETGVKVHRGGALLTMEGPAFSTRAEINAFRDWGMDIIGMTTFQEAKLAREAEMCYAALALVTDSDCWKKDCDVSVEMVVSNLAKSIANAKTILNRVVSDLPRGFECGCGSALKGAIMTDPKAVPKKVREKYALLAGKYLKV